MKISEGSSGLAGSGNWTLRTRGVGRGGEFLRMDQMDLGEGQGKQQGRCEATGGQGGHGAHARSDAPPVGVHQSASS